MTELEIDMNMRIGEWSIIQESGRELVPCYGPGYTGLVNLGNSCYLNSVMQVMFSLPEFKARLVCLFLSLVAYSSTFFFSFCVSRYFDTREGIFQGAPANPTNDFEVQM